MFEKVGIRPAHGRTPTSMRRARTRPAPVRASVDALVGTLRRSRLSHAGLLRIGTVGIELSDRRSGWGVDAVPTATGAGRG
ncbi:hypothetical protein [Streptomyces sp. NPDC060198]|uniref:hypothetical protein n=1 Tax=Streptomyces sp. NPDC060198 TaxID=3347070 RepID=UPI00364D70E4